MRIPKRYGASRVDNCPFCGKQAITSNKQGVPTCLKHKDKELLDLKCMCGDWLDLLDGKYGPYFKCFKCGNVSFSRAMELNAAKFAKGDESEPKKPSSPPKKQTSMPNKSKETIITSDRVDAYFS